MFAMSNEAKDKGISIGLITAIFMAFTFGIFAPLEFYFVNINDLWFDLYDILPGLLIISILLFLICFVALWVFYNLFGKKDDKSAVIWKIAVIVIGIIGICLYIQGNFLQIGYERLGDEAIDWSHNTVDGVYNLIGWAGMLTLFIVLIYKIRIDRFLGCLKMVMSFIVLIQIVTLSYMAIFQHGLVHKNGYVATTENESILSEDYNYITLLLDNYDSRVLDDLLKTDRADEYKEIMQDFTYYRNTLTLFTLTDFSIPQILTGNNYLNQCDYGDFVEMAYSNSHLLDELTKEEYDINIYTNTVLPRDHIGYDIKNWHKVDFTAKKKTLLFKNYYELLAYRYLPHFFKRFFEIDIKEFDNLRAIKTIDGHTPDKEGNIDIFSYENSDFIRRIPDIEATGSGKSYHFYHIKGIHHVRDLDENFNVSTEPGMYGEGLSLEESAKMNMRLVDMFLDKLREEGVYDNSVIIIMADHGARVYDDKAYKQSPLLCIKGIGENHVFKINEAPVSFMDLEEGFLNLMNGKPGDDAFSVKEGDERIRKLYYAKFKSEMHQFTRNDPFIEFETKGHAQDPLSLERTGNEY